MQYILHTAADAVFYRSILAPCYQQKSTRYKIRIRDRAKYSYRVPYTTIVLP